MAKQFKYGDDARKALEEIFTYYKGKYLVLQLENNIDAVIYGLKQAKEKNMLIDATQGRKTQAILIMDSDHVVSTYLKAETILNRSELEGSGDGE